MPISDTLFLNLVSRVENGFGRLEEGQIQNRMASEQRSKELHKRIDKLEEKIEAHKVTPPSSTGLLGTLKTIVKVVEVLFTHRAKIVWGASMLAALWGIQNPELLRIELQKLLTQATK